MSLSAGVCGSTETGFSKASFIYDFVPPSLLRLVSGKSRLKIGVMSSPTSVQKELRIVGAFYINSADTEVREVGVAFQQVDPSVVEAKFIGKFPGSENLKTVLVKKLDGKFKCSYKK